MEQSFLTGNTTLFNMKQTQHEGVSEPTADQRCHVFNSFLHLRFSCKTTTGPHGIIGKLHQIFFLRCILNRTQIVQLTTNNCCMAHIEGRQLRVFNKTSQLLVSLLSTVSSIPQGQVLSASYCLDLQYSTVIYRLAMVCGFSYYKYLKTIPTFLNILQLCALKSLMT